MHNYNGHPSTAPLSPLPGSPPAPAPEVRRALPVEVRRALPIVRRAELVSSRTPAPLPSIPGTWHSVRLLDGKTIVQACYKGQLHSSSDLPNQGSFIGEEWSTDTGENAHDWIWMVPEGANFASWVDP